MFVTKNKQKLHRFDQIADDAVFEVQSRCSLPVMTPEEAYTFILASAPHKGLIIRC